MSKLHNFIFFWIICLLNRCSVEHFFQLTLFYLHLPSFIYLYIVRERERKGEGERKLLIESQQLYACIYIYIYIYVCVCVCVCVYKKSHDLKVTKGQFLSRV